MNVEINGVDPGERDTSTPPEEIVHRPYDDLTNATALVWVGYRMYQVRCYDASGDLEASHKYESYICAMADFCKRAQGVDEYHP